MNRVGDARVLTHSPARRPGGGGPAASGPAWSVAGAWRVLVAAALWGTTGTAQQLGPAVGAAAVGALRLVGGVVVLWLVWAVGEIRAAAGSHRPADAGRVPATRRPVAWWARSRMLPARGSPRTVVALTVAAGAATATFQVTFFAAVNRVGVALGTVVVLACAPVLTALLGWVTARQRLTVWWTAGTALAIVGLVVLLSPRAGGRLDLTGLALAMTCSGCYAVYTTAAQGLVHRGVPHSAAVRMTVTVGAVLGAPLLAGVDLGAVPSRSGLLMVGWLGAATTAAAYTLFVDGLRCMPAGTAATLGLSSR